MAKKEKKAPEEKANQTLEKRIKELESQVVILKGEAYVWKSKFEASEREKDNAITKKRERPSSSY